MKRGGTDICAMLAVDKPAGASSHDIVNAIRRITGEGRVGHCGTLDPFATGLLIVNIGPATRLSDYVMGKSKRYDALIRFGFSTDTDDRTGSPLETGELREELLDKDFAASLLSGFIGKSMQVPSAFSAKKVDGRRAYELARNGMGAELKPVEIEIGEISLESISRVEDENGAGILWSVGMEVSKGTYIRAFARDLGMKAGCPAHLVELRRTAIGNIDLSQAHSIDEISVDGLRNCFIDPVEACSLARCEVDAQTASLVGNGSRIGIDRANLQQERIAIVYDGRMLAIYEALAEGDPQAATRICKPCVVIPGGVEGVR
ncbi:MAG: tRNA pseudouridine(55) synthase TruB [Coriobacteriales bacterium]|nr:tRNA pseudouridine(55) synthase TruB [Coriobacteriales bacterium]